MRDMLQDVGVSPTAKDKRSNKSVASWERVKGLSV